MNAKLDTPRIALPEQHPVPDGALAVWVIYEKPHDCPDGYVLRPHFSMPNGSVLASEVAWYAKSIEEIYSILPPGVMRFDRHANDHACIREVWL